MLGIRAIIDMSNDKDILKKELREIRFIICNLEGESFEIASNRMTEIKKILNVEWERESRNLVLLNDSKRGDV